jgi:cytochrome P450
VSSPTQLARESFFSPALIENPYAVYKRFRDKGDIHHIKREAGPPLWVVFSHAECCQLFRDPRLTAKRSGSMLAALPQDRQAEFAPLAHMLGLWMLFLDAPEHSRLRKLMDKCFSTDVIDG